MTRAFFFACSIVLVASASACSKPNAIVDAGVAATNDVDKVDAGVKTTLSEADRARLSSTLHEALVGKDCPAGTRRVGAEPPDGHEVWCEKTGPGGKAIKEGPYEAWHQNGVKSISGQYVDNERDGVWVEWDADGTRKQEATYKKGKLDGRFREWDHGTPVADALYANGKVVH